VSWHAANLARNRAHYSLLGAAGPRAVVAVAEAVGAGVYFNPFVKVGSQARTAARKSPSRLIKCRLTMRALSLALLGADGQVRRHRNLAPAARPADLGRVVRGRTDAQAGSNADG